MGSRSLRKGVNEKPCLYEVLVYSVEILLVSDLYSLSYGVL